MNASHPNFRWLERGEGEPVVLLHGLMGEMDHWESTLEALAPRYRAGARDADPRCGARRGVHRRTGPPRRRLPGRARDPAGRDRRQLARRPPGARAGAPRPGRASGLILTGSLGPLRARLHPRRAPPRRPRNSCARRWRRSSTTPAGHAAVGRVRAAGPQHARVALGACSTSPARQALESRGTTARDRVPTLLVWGKDDRITPPEVAERFRPLLAGRRSSGFIASCGHAPMLEQPATFNALVEDWLDETAPRAGGPRRRRGRRDDRAHRRRAARLACRRAAAAAGAA